MTPEFSQAGLDDLVQSVALTGAIRRCVGAGDWQAASDFVADRRSLLERFFAERRLDAQPAAVVAAIGEMVTEIVRADAELARALETARDIAAVRVTEMVRGRNGAQTYRDHAT